MHGQGSYHLPSRQVPQTPIAPPRLQFPLPPPPPLPHNLQSGLLQPQPGLVGSQNSPIAPCGYENVANAKQHLQHSSYLAPGSHPPSLLGPHPEMTQSLLPSKGLSCTPPPSQGQLLYRPSVHQLPQQQGGVQGFQQIPPPPQMPLAVPPPPAALPSSQPLVPPPPRLLSLSSPQMLSLSSPVSQLSGNKLGSLGSDDKVIPTNQGAHHSAVCAGSLYVKGGSLNELGCKLDKGKTCSPPRVSGIEPSMQPSHLMGAAQSHSLADSDMEMEDDITQSDNDQASHHPIDRLIKSIGSGGEFEVKEQFHALQGSSQSDAAAMFLPEKATFSGSSGLDDGEQGSKLISCHNQLTNGRLASEVHSPAINSTGAAECPLTTNGEYSSTPLADEKSSSRAVAGSGEIIEGSSPFKLLQGYASETGSENNGEPCRKYAIPKTVSSFVGSEISHDAGFNWETGTGSKSSNKTIEGFGLLSESSISCRAKVVSSNTQRESNKAISESTSDHIGSMHGHQTSIHYAASPKGFLKEVPSSGACTNVSSGKHHKDDDNRTSNFASNTQKIDEFGRLVREGASDSDTDDSRYVGRHSRRRKSRSYSRSRSPLDRRRRRNPRMRRRRRENRSRSRSWSPRRRRSRSKSPSFRHAGGNLRRGRQMPDCFDFLRGKCYRGASCRYLHHDSVKSEGSRHHRRKHEDMKKISREVSNLEYEIMSQAVQPSHNMPTAAAIKEGNNVNTKDDSVSGALEPVISKEDAVDADIPGSLGDVSANVPEKIIVRKGQEDCTIRVEVKFQEAMECGQPLVVDSFPSKSLSDADVLKSREKASQDVLSSLRNSVVQQSQSDLLDEEADNSSISDSSAIKASITSPKKLHARETFGNATDSVQNRFQLAPLPIPAPLLEGTSALQMTEPSRDSTLMPHAGAFQSQSAALEYLPPHMLPPQNTVFLAPPNSSWASLPPPPPRYNSTVNAGMAPPAVSLQFQHTQLPPRNDFGSQMFLRHNPTDMARYFQVGEFQHQAYQEVCEPRHPFSGSFDKANQYTQLTLPSQEPTRTKTQTYLGDSVVSGKILKPSSHIHANLQQQQQSCVLSHTAPDNVHGPSSSRYPPDSLDSNQPSHLTDFAESKSSSHNKPYASTFEQPHSSRFSSDIFWQETNAPYTSTYDYSSGLNHASVDGQAVSGGSEQPILLPNSAGDVGQIIPGSGGDQYDPLFDCIEPASNSFKTLDHIQKWESDDSAIMLRSGGSHKPLDVQETNKKKEVGGISKVDGISLSTSLDNEEFGETADAEVGVAENQSQSNPAVANVCEMEIDQIKSPGKSKKSKESRSTKLFKVALADFVKEILKPSWRQGNMSKEAFKTIVKKTVDKVSGAMKSHQIPKSKSKIDRYIDSAQRKLTELVMGYVDKYARG